MQNDLNTTPLFLAINLLTTTSINYPSTLSHIISQSIKIQRYMCMSIHMDAYILYTHTDKHLAQTNDTKQRPHRISTEEAAFRPYDLSP